MLKWVTNGSKEVNERTVVCLVGESFKQAVDRANEFRSSLVEGLPKASETYTVSELQSFGMIGLYREE